MMTNVRHRLRLLTFIAATIGGTVSWAPTIAQAQWPTKPVRMVVPYPPGGATDIVARAVAERLTVQLGQPFIVENRAGGGGNIGAEYVARGPADGSTLLVATTAHAINKSLFPKLGYDIVSDFVAVSVLTRGPLVLVTNPEFAVKNVRELVAMAKTKPGSIAFASSGNGQSTHMAGELFATTAGVQLRHVPYKGGAPALNDVIAGHVPIMFDAMLSAMPFVKAGRLRILGVTSTERSPAIPDVPTLAESGLPGFEINAWYGVLVPAATPEAIVRRLSTELRAALSHSAVQQKLQEQGLSSGWAELGPTSEYLRSEVEKWTRVVKASGATVE